MVTVGVFEAKTKLSELLDRVAQGEEIMITRHGKPVARLVAPERAEKGAGRFDVDAVRAIAKRFQAAAKEPFTSADINDILYDKDGLPK